MQMRNLRHHLLICSCVLGEYKAEEYSDAQGKWIINPETQIQILVEVKLGHGNLVHGA